MGTIAASELKSAIGSANTKFMAAFKRHDAAAIAGLYTAEAQLLPPQSDFVSGPNAIRQFWESVIALGIDQVVLETIDVAGTTETVIEVGRYTLLAPGGVQADRGKYLVVWRNEAGGWKLHRDIWNTSQPAA